MILRGEWCSQVCVFHNTYQGLYEGRDWRQGHSQEAFSSSVRDCPVVIQKYRTRAIFEKNIKQVKFVRACWLVCRWEGRKRLRYHLGDDAAPGGCPNPHLPQDLPQGHPMEEAPPPFPGPPPSTFFLFIFGTYHFLPQTRRSPWVSFVSV